MPNLVGIGNSQVPTNAMLGGLAYQDSVGEIDINKIKASTADTAIDVFVYDTRKDSDSGAWRKKTKNTSWYNEDESGTRGARKEFPAVAVVVLTSVAVVIYDGDDPDLSMWMKFDISFNNYAQGSTMLGGVYGGANQSKTPTGIVMMNGQMWMSRLGVYNSSALYGAVNFVDFIQDLGGAIGHAGGNGIAIKNPTFAGNILERNSTPGDYGEYKYWSDGITNSQCNDVAITVLPNAPIDAETGLPTPTIAVSTDDGINFLRDDGTVIDMTINTSSNQKVKDLNFVDSNKIAFRHFGNWIYHYPIPSSDSNSSYWNGLTGFIGRFTDTQRDWTTNGIPINVGSNGIANFLEDKAVGHTNGLDLVDIKTGVDDTKMGYGMHCGIATNFNTGWQQGDIKCALLSDTNATDVSHSNITSGWATASNWTYQSQRISLTSNGSQISITHDDGSGQYVYSYLPITVETNSDYNIFIEFGAYNSSDLEVVPTAYNSNNERVVLHGVGGTRKSGYFTSGPHTTLYLMINHNSTTATTINNIVVQKIIEKDRSDHPKGLTVYGTVKKRIVAAGAELVSYNNLTSSNYLEQPYNTNLNFGTGDFCMMGWFYNLGLSSSILYRLHNSTTVGIGYIVALSSGGELGYSSYTQGFRSTGRITHYTTDTWNGQQRWNMFVCGKKGGYGFTYVNGILKQTAINANSHSDTTYKPPLRIGNNHAGNGGIGGGKLALIRISSTFPSIEQIKKMYNDEKQLFSERAKCTLIGTSNSINTIAHDDTTGILHVGTGSGRSDFRGLNRINNTTEAVTTAISASNGLVAED